MQRLQRFVTAARQGGFVEIRQKPGETVLWLHRDMQGMGNEANQHMCIDRVTNSATVYWMPESGKVNCKTFRGVSALQDWFNRVPDSIPEQ